MAGEMESELAKLNGVAHVKANPLTGYVLVLFDSQVISHYQVFAVINDWCLIVCLRFSSLSQAYPTHSPVTDRTGPGAGHHGSAVSRQSQAAGYHHGQFLALWYPAATASASLLNITRFLGAVAV
jgi:hypothetical protein